MLDKLKNFDARTVQLDEAMVLAAQARSLDQEYEALKIERPRWFAEKLADLRRYIADTQRDERKRLLAEMRARRDALKKPEERRAELDNAIAELEASLA